MAFYYSVSRSKLSCDLSGEEKTTDGEKLRKKEV